MDGPHDQYFRESLLETAGHGDGHVLAVAIALLLAILTGRSDICIAGVFGAGKTRSLAVLLIALSCELEDFFCSGIYERECCCKGSGRSNQRHAPTDSNILWPPAWTH